MNNLKNKKILITAGPTREYIDPVRYISNDSSGRMGYALAAAAIKAGAKVTLISGPVNIKAPKVKKFISVISAKEMFAAAMKELKDMDIIICAAAVADYRPKKVAKKKIKKNRLSGSGRKDSPGVAVSLELIENPDILKTIGERKRKSQILIGFALETNNLIKNAKEKLRKKNCDLIAANYSGVISKDSSSVVLIYRTGAQKKYLDFSKKKLASLIIKTIT